MGGEMSFIPEAPPPEPPELEDDPDPDPDPAAPAEVPPASLHAMPIIAERRIFVTRPRDLIRTRYTSIQILDGLSGAPPAAPSSRRTNVEQGKMAVSLAGAPSR